MTGAYVHGYDPRENLRLQDQASTLVELLHSDTAYPAGSSVLEAGCGIGAQTITLAANSPEALITSIDVSEASVAEARRVVHAAGIKNVTCGRQTSSVYRFRLRARPPKHQSRTIRFGPITTMARCSN
jgi:tRNA G46 methylase TrmB